jgi:hypothetical protein
MPVPCEAVVSIQLATAPDALTGFLAWGALIDRDRVATPGPLDWLRDPTVRFHVLLASARRDGAGVVERLEVERAEILGLAGNPDGAAAVLHLAQPSRQHKPDVGAGISAADIATAIGGQPDVWTALEAVGGVPRGLRDLPVDRVLGPVVEWERITREGLVTTDLSATPDDAGIRWCCLFYRCPCDCPGQWW